MKKLSIITVSLMLTLLLSACFAVQEAPESSGAVEVATLVIEDTAAEEAVVEETMADEEMEDETHTEDAEMAEEEYSDEEPAAEEIAEESEMDESAAEMEEEVVAEPAGAGQQVFTIDPAQSEARFLLDEVLRGDDFTVVGVTNNLAGQIAVDFADPASAQVSEIAINARDIVTDNEFRNRAISNRILETADYEFITFIPTAITGLDAAAIGEASTFQMTGDLTIKDQTREVTFDVTVTPTSDTELTGLATASILHADFGLEIPFSQSVQSVEEDVTLELEFVATVSN